MINKKMLVTMTEPPSNTRKVPPPAIRSRRSPSRDSSTTANRNVFPARHSLERSRSSSSSFSVSLGDPGTPPTLPGEQWAFTSASLFSQSRNDDLLRLPWLLGGLSEERSLLSEFGLHVQL